MKEQVAVLVVTAQPGEDLELVGHEVAGELHDIAEREQGVQPGCTYDIYTDRATFERALRHYECPAYAETLEDWDSRDIPVAVIHVGVKAPWANASMN